MSKFQSNLIYIKYKRKKNHILGNEEIADLLIKNGANVNIMFDHTPLHYAVETGNI